MITQQTLSGVIHRFANNTTVEMQAGPVTMVVFSQVHCDGEVTTVSMKYTDLLEFLSEYSVIPASVG